MDVFTRAVRARHLSHSLDRRLTLTALQRAVEIQISVAAVGKLEENGFADWQMRTFKRKKLI